MNIYFLNFDFFKYKKEKIARETAIGGLLLVGLFFFNYASD